MLGNRQAVQLNRLRPGPRDRVTPFPYCRFMDNPSSTITVAHTDSDLADLPLERLEAELCTWSANLAAAEYRWFALLAEFDRRHGWQQWECHSCVAWMC